MLYDILPKWTLFTFVIFVILFSIVAEWLLQRKEKEEKRIESQKEVSKEEFFTNGCNR